MPPTVPTAEQAAGWVEFVEKHPLAAAVLGLAFLLSVLWGSLTTVALWATRTQREDARAALRREREISQRLDRDLERARDETDQVRRRELSNLVKLSTAAEGLVRISDELKQKAGKHDA